MRIDENEKIDIWLAGNTGLRNPMRIQEGFIAFSKSLSENSGNILSEKYNSAYAAW